jgi:hypothetical protein
MLPGIQLRIQNLIKAMQEVVLPAIPSSERLAADQAALVVGHLRMIAAQWRDASRFEAQSLEQLLNLANRIVVRKDIPIADSARAALEAVCKRYQHIDRFNDILVSEAVKQVGSCIDNIILGEGIESPINPELMKEILKYGGVQARRERTWFQDNMLDPGRAELPSIREMLAEDA